jgi:capsular exopolysaccharide synthesis family protein
MAMGNKKTLLLGLDLRKPSIHKIFKYENSSGISSYLEGKDSIENILQPSEIPNLSIAYSGPVPPNPSELIETNDLKSLFQWARDQFDYIVIDTPPLALVPDAMLIADYSDMNLFVIRYNYSKKQVLSLINRLNEKSRFKELNIIVNDLRTSRYLGYGYEYGYGYAYGYGYGYYNKSYYTEG